MNHKSIPMGIPQFGFHAPRFKAMNNNNTRHSAPQAEPVVQKFKSTALSDPKQEITVTSSADSKNKHAL